MLRKLFSLMMSSLMLLCGIMPAMAESFEVRKEAPSEPIETDAEFVHISCAYDAASNRSVYTLTLKDGAPVTARDLLFTYYVYLDPGYSGDTALSDMAIPGARSYRMQYDQERLNAALEQLAAIRDAGEDHVWSESDGWTAETQDAWWTLYDEYLAACAEGFPALAQEIVDYCIANVRDALDHTAEEITASENLKVAFSMVQWGHASYENGRLTTKHSRTVWDVVSGILPTLEDYAEELRQVYAGDLARAWSIECPNSNAVMPKLPDVESAFIAAVLGDEHDEVTSIEGIRLIDDVTIEIALEDIDMRSDGVLFGMPVFRLAECGDEAQWSPESGQYGHPFGDVSAVDLSRGTVVYQSAGFVIPSFS